MSKPLILLCLPRLYVIRAVYAVGEESGETLSIVGAVGERRQRRRVIGGVGRPATVAP